MDGFEVIGTVRQPDGRSHGSIEGLVVRERGLLVVLTEEEARRRLTCTATPADLRFLPIWDRERACWVSPRGPEALAQAG
jgi:hypothetical protein